MTFTPKVTLLQLPPFSDASSAEHGIVERELEWVPNPMRETGEENRETTKNILAP